MNAYPDRHGRQLAVGDHVVRIAVDDGAPLWASNGTVVGFGRSLVRVQWAGYGYDAHKPHHSTPGHALRATGRPTAGGDGDTRRECAPDREGLAVAQYAVSAGASAAEHAAWRFGRWLQEERGVIGGDIDLAELHRQWINT